MSSTGEKLRALFLAFVMVLSVFGGTVAFAGTAAAQTGTTIDPGSEAAGQTTQFIVSTTVESGDDTEGDNLNGITINQGGSAGADSPDFSDVDDQDILRVGIDTDQDGAIESSLISDLAASATSTSNSDATLTIDLSNGDSDQPAANEDILVELADVTNPTNTGDKTITVGLDPATGSTSDDGTLTVSQSLQVSTSPSSVTRGETANVDVSITDQNDNAFTGQAQVAIIGLTNTNDDNAAGTAGSATVGESNDGNGETNLDDAANDRDYTVLKSGSTTSGTFTTSISLAGTGQNANSNDRAIGEYFVVVRRGSTSFSTLTPFSGPNDDNDNVVTNNFDGSALLDATPSATVEISDVTRGDSPTISGSVTVSDGSGLTDYPVTIQNLNASVSPQVGSTTTAGNGDFATTETLADAATHSATLELYNTSTNSLENFDLSTFDVAPNSLSVSTSSSSFTASIAESDTITLTADGADTQENTVDVNVTRFRLSGLELSGVDVSGDGGNAFIDKVTLTNGNSAGTIDGIEEAAITDGSVTGITAVGGSGDLDTDSNANIESIVLGTDNSAPDGNNDLDVKLEAPNAGDLTVEGQVEDTDQGADTANTPISPDFVGTQTITVEEPSDLNVEVSPQTIEIADNDVNPADDDQPVTVTVRDSDGNGLINGAGNGQIQSLTFDFEGNGTQFQLDTQDGAIAGAGTTANFDSSGLNQGSASVTIDQNTASSSDTTFDVTDVLGEQNGTIDVTVTADVNGQSEDITDSESITVTDSVSADGLPSGDLTVGTVTDINVSVTDGAGTPINNAQLVIGSQGPNNDNANTDSDVFALDTNGDGQNDITGIDALAIDGASGTVDIEQSGDGGYDEDTSTSVTVNNGEYKLEGLNVTSAGEDIDILVTSGGEAGGDAKAFFPDQLSTVGQEVYDVSTDVDPFVAGFQEQVNITVSENGQTINGSDLTRLADTDGDATTDNFQVEQQGASVISGVSTVDTNDDNTVDTIRGVVDADEDGSAAVNITTQSNDQTEVGQTSVGVQAPQVQTNVTSAQLTENIQQDVSIEVVDPRDGSTLESDNNGDNPALRLTAFNTSFEYQDADGGNDFDIDGNNNGQTTEPTAFDAANTNNGEVNATVMTYPDGDSGPQRLNFEVSFDGRTDYFGSDNVTVGAQQVSASPSNIELGSETEVQVTATDANGRAIPQQGTSLSGAASTSGSTDDSGFIAFTVNPSATGTISVNIDSDGLDVGGSSSPPASTTEEIINVTTEQSEFDVTVDPQTVTANTTTTVTVTATNNASGDAVEGASVDLSGAGVNESAQTDANGEAAIDVTASETGTIEVTVNDAGFNPATLTITVEEAGTGSPLDGPAGRFDNNGDGDISITELGAAGTAFAQGDLTIAELGAVGQEFAS